MRLARCLVITALAAGLLSPAATARAEPSERLRTTTITLISGDKVVVNERGELLGVEGRPGMQFAQYVRDDHQYVVPADAVEAVRQDLVDKRFFDVTALHGYGYSDDKIDRIPLLTNGFRAAGAVPKKDAAQQWAARRFGALRAGKLWLDGKSKISLTESVPMVGAPGAWQAGFDGTGVTVAVLDTGYDLKHPELAGVVTASKDFTPAGIQDDVGHGTHVAATIAGRDSRYAGVAKGASLAVGRVCEADFCYDSAVIAGMEWAAREVGAKVVNMSLGGDQSDGTDPMSLKVNELTAETGALFVVAAGNAGEYRKVSSPASADAALAVANLTKAGGINESSSRGPRITDHAVKPDIAAPGTDIVAARAENTLWEHAVDDLHAKLTGTSMAAPHVAGAAAVLAQRNPSWKAAELKAHLMATVEPVADTPANVGTGLLDAERAVRQQVRASTGSLSFGLLEWPHTGTSTKTITYSNAGAEPVTLELRHDLGASFTVPDAVTVPARGSASVDVVLDPARGNGTFFGHVRATGGGVSLTTAVGAYVQEERHELKLSMIGRDGKPVANEFVVVVNLTTRDASVITIGADGTGSSRLAVADYALIGRIDELTPNYAWFTPVSATEVAGRVSLTADLSVVLDARQGRQIGVELPDRDSEVWYRDADLSVPFKPGKINGVASVVDGRVPLYGLSFGPALPELTYDSGLKGGQPLVSVVGGFPVRYFESSKHLAPGDHALDVAERGTDVRGKLALVRTAGEDVFAVAQAMKDAGAVAVLWAGPVPFGQPEQTAIPVIAVAEHLVAVTPAKLTLRAIAGSPVSYTLFLRDKGALPSGTRKIRHAELAEVKARYHTSGADGSVVTRNYPMVNGSPARNLGVVLDERLAAPAQRTEYFTAGGGIGWYQEGFAGRGSGAGDDPSTTSWAALAPVTFQPGRKYERTNLRAVASPRLGGSSVVTWADGGGVERAGDLINARISPFGGSDWVENWRRGGGGWLELRHNGVVQGYSDVRQGSFHAPARDGRYELLLDASRDGLALSTSVRTSWEFTAAADGRLPLLEVDYSLPVDLRNSWKAGVPMPVKFTASRQSGTVRELQAYASFDDGLNWVPVKSLVPPGGKAGGHVSLRVVARDTDGNSVDQTVLRAYRLRA
ncbi:S8 family serine peptidase [Lentzea jiangxiensis]|uniref:Subtilase family protein n=1 Tax=Lentzea jiangxiensis TaxID=641025 RepID=A0A1H0WPW8_9PSEU|nr:S8 family serine peptidase [Lentzea jiangxiensis]SDP92677.1 Subtilase family protein [Lentzea jiangxiensis]